MLKRPNFREARLWRPHEREGWVICDLCHRRCSIAPGKYGVCGVRLNVGGKLYSAVYGLLTAASIDPIEKKPLYHFYPGSSVMSVSTVGCNFFCKFCQNWEISQSRLERGLAGTQFTPERVVELTRAYGADGISYTYNEPTIFFEFMEDVARLARRFGLFNTMVTNGYMTPEAVDALGDLIDAATVDFKGGGSRGFYSAFMNVRDPELIFETIRAMKERGWWIEITNLVVPKYGDDEEQMRRLARWTVENVGPETPFHLLRFHPDYKMTDVPRTPLITLERLARISLEEGLKHVYIGNVLGHELEHTYCPSCGYRVIERIGFHIVRYDVKEGRCPRCGYRLNIKGEGKQGSRGHPFPLM